MMRSAFFVCLVLVVSAPTWADPWQMHVTDGSLRGADGVRLDDFNGDGLLDVVTGWEESGKVRLYLNPGPAKSHLAWPLVTVGAGKSPEDAVAMDVDGDGDLDVISCHEGKEQKILVHSFVGDTNTNAALLSAKNWKTSVFDQVEPQQWMFATPIKLRDGRSAFIAGAKNTGATLTLFPRPNDNAADLSTWKPHVLRKVGWIMSMTAIDMDSDGDDDLVCSDRKGSKRGVFWLEQPDNDASKKQWTEHTVGATDKETLFIDASKNRILAATRNASWLDFRRSTDGAWSSTKHANPTDIPMGKAIKRLNAQTLVMTANTGADKLKSLRPAIWVKQADQPWQPIGKATKAKYDRIECIDLDGDGDLDVMTCEEKRNLGVIWYENPKVKISSPNH